MNDKHINSLSDSDGYFDALSNKIYHSNLRYVKYAYLASLLFFIIGLFSPLVAIKLIDIITLNVFDIYQYRPYFGISFFVIQLTCIIITLIIWLSYKSTDNFSLNNHKVLTLAAITVLFGIINLYLIKDLLSDLNSEVISLGIYDTVYNLAWGYLTNILAIVSIFFALILENKFKSNKLKLLTIN